MRHRIRGWLVRCPARGAVHRAPPGNSGRRDDPCHRGTGPIVGGRGQDPPTQNHPAQPGFASHLGVLHRYDESIHRLTFARALHLKI